MTCLTPVIAANTSALVEVVGEAGILVEPEAEEFAAAVTQIVGWSKSKRQTQLENAAKHAAKFSWAKTAADTAKVYQQLVATG
jgi:glycosyltransferase involved in cell wall biosynthesis